jgi:peptide/nickel transport system permease protein
MPLVTMLGMDMGLMFGGAVFVETIFALPGLGRTSVLALQRQDLPTLMGVIVWSTTAILVFNLLVDVLYTWVDPRVRMAPRREPRVRAPAPAASAQPSQVANARS